MILLLWINFSTSTFAQVDFYAEVVDTIELGEDTIVLFTDKSWEYLDAIHFNGIMNPYLADIIDLDTTLGIHSTWNNDIPFTTENDLTGMEDTMWLCTIDSNFRNFCLPFDGLVTSTFKKRGSRFHYGIDIDLETGDTVRAAFDGRVRYAQYNNSGYGKLVIIRHYNGLETYYAHLSKFMVSPNQKVKAGTPIGLGGKSGKVTGSHLHFECRFFDNPLDPMYVIDFENKSVTSENLFIHKNLFDYKNSNSRPKQSRNIGKPLSTEETGSDQYHTIKRGESLYGLSRKYKCTVSDLCKWNNITEKTILKVGTVLRVK